MGSTFATDKAASIANGAQMLELQQVSLQLGTDAEDPLLLTEVSIRFPRKHFTAVIGPSGCGKSTLLKVIGGLREPTVGHVEWNGRNLSEDGDMDPHEIGYVPQFSIAYDLLTVWESVESALRLRVGGLNADEREERIDRILAAVGLNEIADREVRVLSGGQKRRLAMALEMVSSPHLLLCDEVTSGLDPKAEDEIVKLMHQLSRDNDRIVLSVTHSLRHLALYDSVLVLYRGHVAYHGTSKFLFHYFGIEQPEDLFPQLAQRQPEDWHRSWQKHGSAYAVGGSPGADTAAPEEASEHPASEDDEARKRVEELLKKAGSEGAGKEAEKKPGPEKDDGESLDPAPSALAQFGVLLGRRWKIFFRDRGGLWLQFALLIGFPILVVIFALDGLPQIKNPNGILSGNFVQEALITAAQKQDMMKTGSLVSGLIMFQVVLLALMGSNNAAREIAGERLIFEKEKFAGVEGLLPRRARARAVGVDGCVRQRHRAVQGQPRHADPPAHAGQRLADRRVPRPFQPDENRRASLARFRLSRRLSTPAQRRRARAAKGAEHDHATIHRLLLGLVRLHPDHARDALFRCRESGHANRNLERPALHLVARLPRLARPHHRLHRMQELPLGVVRTKDELRFSRQAHRTPEPGAARGGAGLSAAAGG
jgi:ABC-type multidrug transport system ATPase subunit